MQATLMGDSLQKQQQHQNSLFNAEVNGYIYKNKPCHFFPWNLLYHPEAILKNPGHYFLSSASAFDGDAGDYAGFEKDGCRFILQKFDSKEFAENLMISVQLTDVTEFWKQVNEKQLPQRFGIRILPPVQMPYGKESNLIDPAGVCWHFVQP
jgi:hypothetical protein